MRGAELAIVGGGPAGAATAIAAALRGLDTVLFDDPARGTQPGETLPPGAETLFRMLGVEAAVNKAALIRHRGHWSDWSGGNKFERFGEDLHGPWRGYQVARTTLRHILLRRAKDLGVRVVNQRCRGVLLDGSKVVGVRTSTDTMSCRFVVDASGASHWLARSKGDRIRAASDRLVAWFGWASSARACTYAEPRLTIHEDGWTWIAQTERKVCAWVRLDSRPGNGRRFTKPEVLRSFRPVGTERGTDVTRRIVERQGGEGFLYVGDAGALLDPASSHGVVRALMSGMAAANHAARVVQLGLPLQTEVSAYDRWIRSAFAREVAALRLFDRTAAQVLRADPRQSRRPDSLAATTRIPRTATS